MALTEATGCTDQLSHAHPVLGSDHMAVVCTAAPTSYSLSLTVLNLSFSDFPFLIPLPPQFFFFTSICSPDSHQSQADDMLCLASFPISCHAPSMPTRPILQRELGGPLRLVGGMEPAVALPRVDSSKPFLLFWGMSLSDGVCPVVLRTGSPCSA